MWGSLILCYHRVNDEVHSCLQPTKVAAFEKQMRYLSKVYHPVPLEKVVHHLREGTPPPPKSIALTFYDGYRDNYENAYPILKKYGIPATIFLTTGYIGTGEIPWWERVYQCLNQVETGGFTLEKLEPLPLQAPFDKKSIHRLIRRLKQFDEDEKNRAIADIISQCEKQVDLPSEGAGLSRLSASTSQQALMLSWEEVREMRNNGISFGAHTLTHPLLTHVPPEQARKEIDLSKNSIEEQIGEGVLVFAYPGGDFDASIARMVQDAGYSAAVSMNPGRNRLRTNVYVLKRNAVRLSNKFECFPVFMAEVTGILGYVRKFYERLKYWCES